MNSYNYKSVSSSGLVKSGPGGVHTVTLAAGVDDATAILYENIAGSGTVICKLAAMFS